MPKEVYAEQEVEVVSLIDDSSPSTPKRKGYEDYLKEAEDAVRDVGNEDDEVLDKETDVPEKFKGKSLKEVIESYTQLESEFGRRNQEVGELRKVTDQFLQLSEQKSKQESEPKTKAVEVDDLLENPQGTINSIVDDNPRLKAIEEKLSKDEITKQKDVFEKKHPDWQTTLRSPEFIEWIKQSPFRQRMLLTADKTYDYATGSELFDEYKETRGKAIDDATQERDGKAKSAARSAVTEQGSGGEKKATRKFRRKELVHMKLHNPAKYEAMKEEIMEAYRTGNVI